MIKMKNFTKRDAQSLEGMFKLPKYGNVGGSEKRKQEVGEGGKVGNNIGERFMFFGGAGGAGRVEAYRVFKP